MTDARFPSRWITDRRFARLSAEHFVSYMWALAYAVESGTDGRLEHADFAAIGRYSESSTEALIEAGLFGRDDDGAIQVLDYAETQTSAAEVKAATARRIAARLKKREQRAGRGGRATNNGDDAPMSSPSAEPASEWVTASIPEEEPF